jgi:hypothetical protein
VEALEVMAGDGNGAPGVPGAGGDAAGAEALQGALGALLLDLREQRAAAAVRMTGRIAQRALTRIDNGLELGSPQGHPR